MTHPDTERLKRMQVDLLKRDARIRELEAELVTAEQRGYTRGYNECAVAQQQTLAMYGGRPSLRDEVYTTLRERMADENDIPDTDEIIDAAMDVALRGDL